MGYASALLAKDVSEEEGKLEKQASRKGMLGSIGRTIGTIAAGAVLGPAADPFLKALAVGGSSLIGGAAGSKVAGPITEGKFFKSSRNRLRKELNPFGAENVTGAIKSGVTAGMAQKAKKVADISEAKSTAALAKDSTLSSISAAGKAREASYGGFDFYGSTVGGSRPIQGLLSKHRQSAWEAAGGTTDEADFGEWMNEKAPPVVQRRLSGIGDIGQSTPGDAYTPAGGMDRGFLSKRRGFTDSADYARGQFGGAPIRPRVGIQAEEPSRLLGLPRGETSGLDPRQMPSNMEPPAMLRPGRQMPSLMDVQAGKPQFGEQFPAATRGLQQENLLYDEWRKGLNFQCPQFDRSTDRIGRGLRGSAG